MIRAGRRQFVRTREDLARERGMSISTYGVKAPFKAEGHPKPISSVRRMLWDGEQIDAYNAGKSVPELPSGDSDDDLLDRVEAAAELSVAPKTWDTYKTHPTLTAGVVDVRGVEHWPRRVIRDFQASRPGRSASPGRSFGSGDMIPRDQEDDLVAELLDGDPAITSRVVMDTLDISFRLAVRVLARLRGRRIVDLLETEPSLSVEQAAERLGYPPVVWRGALKAAALEQRVRAVRPYLQQVADALVEHGLARATTVQVQVRAGDVLAAGVSLAEDAPALALAWEDRYGWRTALSRRHPLGRDGAPPTGEGVCYLGGGQLPEAKHLLEALADTRRGSKMPPSPLYPPIIAD